MSRVRNIKTGTSPGANALTPGMILAEDLHHYKGRLILEKGTRLSSKHLRIIKMWGITEAKLEVPPISGKPKRAYGRKPIPVAKTAAETRGNDAKGGSDESSLPISTVNLQQKDSQIKEDMQSRVPGTGQFDSFTLDALEQAARLGNFQTSINQMDSSSVILEETCKRIKSLIPFDVAAFYLVDEKDSEFYLAQCNPEDFEQLVKREVEKNIENGIFGRAIREQKPIFVPYYDISKKIVFHALTTISRVRGMFVGVLTPSKLEVPQVSLSLMTIILLHSANALESYDLYHMIKTINRDLENTVLERSKELQRSQEQLRHAQKMEALGRLAGGVAHDFNNILTAVSIASEVSLQEPGIPPAVRKNFQEILGATERTSSLIRQLLIFSKKQVVNPKVLDINTVVSEIIKMLRHLITEDIEIILEPWENPPPIKADPGQIDQILMNLAVNSQDALHEHPDPSIEKKIIINISHIQLGDKSQELKQKIVNQKGDYIRIRFTDNGIGMDEETRERIFEPFFTTKEKGKGTGLGLSTVYGIVQQNNGGIAVRSTPAKGTTFSIYWPCSRTPGTTELKSSVDTKPGSSKETILLVEDDPITKNTVENLLTFLGYRVLAALNGKSAVNKAKKHGGKIDLLLTDITLPAMDGFQLAAFLREQIPSLKVIFTTGYMDIPPLSLESLPPWSRFIRKPFSLNEISVLIRELLDEK